MRAKYILISLFCLTYIILSTLLWFYFSYDKENRIDIYLSQYIQKLHSELKATKNTFYKLGNFVYDELSQDRRFLRLLQIKDQKGVYLYLFPYYEILKKYNINYLSLLDSEGKTFVDFNKPNKHKRLLSNLTSTNNLIIEFKKPIYFENNLIGFFSFAISYDILRHELERLFHSYYTYIINQKFIKKSIFTYGDHLFVQSDLSENYFYEKSPFNKENPKIKELIHLINLHIKQTVEQKLRQNKNFAIITKVQGRYYIVTFIPIRAKNDTIGYFISYTQDNIVKVFTIIFWQNLLFSNIFIILFLALIYYFLHLRIKFEKMALTDKLTGLYNRHKFHDIAQREFLRSKRTKEPLSIILFDIDHFKRINDTYGHDIGDIVLKEIAQLVKKNVRKYDYLFRWGGEEFLILAPHTNLEQAYKIAEKIRKTIESHNFPSVGKVTTSLGIAQYQEQEDIDTTIKKADNALYQSKQDGRNRTTMAL